MKHPNYILLVAAMILACLPQHSAFAQQATNTQNLLFQYEHGGCRGYCPIYKLLVHNDGTLEFNGFRNVEKVGNQMVKLSPDEFGRLKSQVLKANIWQYSELPITVADAPRRSFTVYQGRDEHKIKGAGELPKQLVELEDLIQEIAESHGIMVKNGVNSDDPANMTGEVVVRFQPGVDAEAFCKQFLEIKVQAIRRLDDKNTWLIGYYPSQIAEDPFMHNILENMEGVLDVRANTH